MLHVFPHLADLRHRLSQCGDAAPARACALVYRDPYLLVADKPSGLLSVPGRGADKQDCLISRLRADCPQALIVHRLDMATSGLLLLALDHAMQSRLGTLFQTRQVGKTYVALVAGRVTQEAGEIDLPIAADWPRRPLQKVDHLAGKAALTRYRVLAYDADARVTRLELSPLTGRTHQLRVHLSAIGHPILGDALYAPPDVAAAAGRLLLHASALAFAHPCGGARLVVASPPPF